MADQRICETCGLPVPPRLVHEPALNRDGTPGVFTCRWMAIDSDGKTWRDRARRDDD